ncbi:MAG: hypothetical protein PHN84_08735 [Desulfuromonadaceae bacterium]|nr:hypothetical protein [Desulfuromonadaceae bacterium]MDD2855480.1 hypothetical protein [Desulfuromonadaceae bacterium]
MKFLRYIVFTIMLFSAMQTDRYALAGEPNIDASEILATIQLNSGKVDRTVYRQFDRLVPKLKKIANNRIIKLECRYSGHPNSKKDVDNAYMLAAKIERYLRVTHKMKLDLWLSIDIAPKSDKLTPVLTIAVFSDDIKALDAKLIDPLEKEKK